ncbi:MAG: hypothetical protein PHT53_06200 [Candidatus Omnitrophica bacterium]|nr:hypothetical protein [Candidatus Omnitrophota bacterium]
MKPTLKNIILSEAKKNPYLGVRGISRILKEKHELNISKSTISTVLRAKGMRSAPGRKKHVLLYQSKLIKDCGLLLLKAIDSELGLYDLLRDELRAYYPSLNANLLKKLITMFSFSSYIGGNIEENAKRPGFLRLCECFSYPAKNVKYFSSRTANYKPAISLEEIKKRIRLVSTVKFYFQNNSTGFSDAKLTTLWDGPCNIDDFFMPLHYVKAKLSKLIKDKTIIIGYTKSFDYLSPLTIRFVDGLSSGINKIELLDGQGKVLEKIECNLSSPVFAIGYYPKILGKGASFLEKAKRFKRLPAATGSVLYVPVLTRFSQSKGAQAVILNNILIKNKEKMLPNWAVLTDRKTNLAGLLEKYIFIWQYMEKSFLSDMKIIENFFMNKEGKKNLGAHIPDILSFEKEADFKQIADILAVIFKEQFKETTFINNYGQYILGKNFCKIVMKGISADAKKEINNTCLYIADKRVFMV